VPTPGLASADNPPHKQIKHDKVTMETLRGEWMDKFVIILGLD
jgi:hypothetical protein